MTAFPANKNAAELGLKVGQQFRVVVSDDIFPKGSIVTLIQDDDTRCPQFSLGDIERYFYLNHLEPINNQENTHMSNLNQQLINNQLSDDDKFLREQGLTDSDGSISSEGTDTFEQWLFIKHKAEFTKDMRELVDQQKADQAAKS